jgi:hypothetical protein
MYSTNVHMKSPRNQYEASSAVLAQPALDTYVAYATGGSHSVGMTHHGVFDKGSRKFPNNGADSPPL